MSDRGLPTVDGAPACPFVAFSDDRDARSTRPDHRHRCFAESPPAPRAVAHQEAYCLSSAFPVCPTFQDWARREAAHAQEAARTADAAAAASSAGAAGTGIVAGSPGTETAPEPGPDDSLDPDGDDDSNEWTERPMSDGPVERNPRRDWAAPPPWATGVAAAGTTRASEPSAPDFLASRSVEGAGLAGSAADRLAGGPPPASVPSGGSSRPSVPPVMPPSTASRSTAAEPDDDLADLVGGRATPPRSPQRSAPPPTAPKRPAVSSTRSRDMIKGPSWEGSRRYEAYPTIRTRAGLPGLPRVAALAGALGIAALALFFLPALLGVGDGGGGGGATGSPSASPAVASASPSPTIAPEPTPQVYVIKTGDTLSKVAKKFGITLDALLAANKATIKDPDKISVGDEIIIPVPPSDDLSAPSASPA